jgi:putative amidase-like protein
MPRYNRLDARTYARFYALNVCHDGAVACVRFGKTVFEHQPPLSVLKGRSIDGQDDCTHFISCCIGHNGGVHLGKGGGQPGGGIPISPDFFQEAYGITGAPRLVKYLIERGFASVIGMERLPNNYGIDHLIKNLELGDLIAYASTEKGGYAHMAFYLPEGNIACHTDCRLDQPWTDVILPYITLLHITY